MTGYDPLFPDLIHGREIRHICQKDFNAQEAALIAAASREVFVNLRQYIG